MRSSLILAAMLLVGCATKDADGDGFSGTDDCDDTNALVNSTAAEICDGIDNDCDGAVDDEDPDGATDATLAYSDVDLDGYGGVEIGTSCTAPVGAVRVGGDCDDVNGDLNPGAVEVCDGVDNNCDDLVDADDPNFDSSVVVLAYADADTDGFGDPNTSVDACTAPAGYVADSTDCNDADIAINPDAAEVCDGVDNNCDTLFDADDPLVDLTTTGTYYADVDNDGFGSAIDFQESCSVPVGYVVDSTDCDDADFERNPGAPEICDGKDNNCDVAAGLLIDDADPLLDQSTAQLQYVDADGDGFGPEDTLFVACTVNLGNTLVPGDCDDADPDRSPNAAEVCDGKDNNCDAAGLIDDADPAFDASTVLTGYLDDDADGYGLDGSAFTACTLPPGTVASAGDCDDADFNRNPGAAEVCDGQDNNCDAASLVDDADPALDLSTALSGFQDADADGYGNIAVPYLQCALPADAVASSDDCDDAVNAVNPGAAEICDGFDNNCDGVVDQGVWWDSQWAYRQTFTVTGGATALEAPMITLDFDGGAALTQLGDASGLTPDGVRVASDDCAAGVFEVPSEFIEEFTGLLESGDGTSAPDDGVGTVVFRYDEDGDLSTRETLDVGETRTFSLYFTSTAKNATAPTARPALTGARITKVGPQLHPNQLTVDNGLVSVTFDRALGGLVSSLAAAGKPSVGDQTSTLVGNGAYFGPLGGGALASWASATFDTSGILTVVHEGPLVTIVDDYGRTFNDYGGLDFHYVTIVFQGREEVYSKVLFQTSRFSHIGPQGASWSQAVRPWQIDNVANIASGGGAGTRDGGYLWTQASYGANQYGLWLGWVTPPASLATPTTDGTGRYLALAGQDFDPAPAVRETNLQRGTTLLNDHVIMAWPYVGTTNGTKLTFLELLQPRNVTIGAASAYAP